MVVLSKIYTRSGDKGKTSLVDGARVSKHHVRVEAYGAVDETNAAIGVVRLYTKGKNDQMLARIQNDLFDLGADLATPHSKKMDKALRIVATQVKRLESEIDAMNKTLKPLNSFVLPGGSDVAAYLHVARTICRRSERSITALMEVEDVNPLALQYTNRLSDHLFVMSRYVNDKGKKDVLWVPGLNR
jgi:cob(I)alamin adenosyltransferase